MIHFTWLSLGVCSLRNVFCVCSLYVCATYSFHNVCVVYMCVQLTRYIYVCILHVCAVYAMSVCNLPTSVSTIEYFVLTSQYHMTVPQLDFEPIIEHRCVAFVCSSSAIRSSYQVVVQSGESVM